MTPRAGRCVRPCSRAVCVLVPASTVVQLPRTENPTQRLVGIGGKDTGGDVLEALLLKAIRHNDDKHSGRRLCLAHSLHGERRQSRQPVAKFNYPRQRKVYLSNSFCFSRRFTKAGT
ncbi:unnamed protein product [Ectocarpus sp. 13 AM-2016]